MNQNDSQNFMDPKTLIAIALSLAVFLGWSFYMNKKYPNRLKKDSQQITTQTNKTSQPQNAQISAAEKDFKTNYNPSEDAVSYTEKDESLFEYNNEIVHFKLSSKGMGFRIFELKNYTERDNSPKIIGYSAGFLPMETNVFDNSRPLDFEITQKDNHFEGVAQYKGMIIKKSMVINHNTYAIDTKIEVSNVNESLKGLLTYLVEREHQSGGGGLFTADQYNIQDYFVLSKQDKEFLVVGQKDELYKAPTSQSKVTYSGIEVVSLGSQYFAQAIYNTANVFPEFVPFVDKGSQSALGILQYPILNRADTYTVTYTTYMGPKDVDILGKTNDKLTEIVNLGFFGSISKILMMGLQMFHKITGNWGLAIILLTLVVRLLMTPIILPSYRNMKKMSALAPHMKRLQEQYKDDPQQRGLAVMALYKEHKVNPLGGCLPMFLQLPIFFALFQVLGKSVDLYQAPFYLWIKDLSVIDPYYVFPVLSAIVMFIQMKTNPSNDTMQPAQKKMMMIMPVFMVIFFIRMPAGLNIYMFVSTLFGFIQQHYFINEKTKDNKAKVVALN